MKIGISADWHIDNKKSTYYIGAKTNREIDLENQVDFMVKKCSEEGVEFFFIAGDIFDKSMIDSYFFTLALKLIDKLLAAGIEVYVIPGNHDWVGARYPITAAIGKLKERGINVINKAIEIELSNIGEKKRCLLIPHIQKKKYKTSGTYQDYVVDLLKENNSDFIIGHFQPIGSVAGSEEEMFAGSSRIVDPDVFKGRLVFCGHVHKPQEMNISENSGIYIVGSPVIFSMKERDDNKRFIIYDTKINVISSIPLPCQKFYKVKIDLFTKSEFILDESKIKKYKGACVGVVVESSKENRIKVNWNYIYEKFESVEAYVVSKRVDIKKTDMIEKIKSKEITPKSVFLKTLSSVVKDQSKKESLKRQGLEILEKLRGNL